MPPHKPQLNTSLQLRGSTWYIYWNIPRPLRSNPLFRGKSIYAKTLKTKDVHEARKMRDILVSQFSGMAEVSSTHESRREFLAHYAASKKAQEELKARPPVTMWTALKHCVEAGLWRASHWSQKFGGLKLKATGKKDRTKGFHSFRHMTATAYERVHMEERIVSVLLGHKNKRGQSMSYGHCACFCRTLCNSLKLFPQ